MGCEQGATYTTLGKEKEVPTWTQFDADPMELAKMIQLNFASARVTHPNCRLVSPSAHTVASAWQPV
jgi:hypothetical protein